MKKGISELREIRSDLNQQVKAYEVLFSERGDLDSRIHNMITDLGSKQHEIPDIARYRQH